MNNKRIVIAGGLGFRGQVLARYFLRAQAEVVVLTRSPGQSSLPGGLVGWDARTLGEWQKEQPNTPPHLIQ